MRSREADRAAGVQADANPTATRGLFRFNLNLGAGLDSFARVRTFQADVALNNQRDVLW